ncbi:energy transducer TonB [Shewanella submarina]|uniref:Energy transducer TonB n=1 Tax=Shewanella submarina TaxID=2016376 RepID=A0ABV7G8L7_9GAMM|nr:energy transducer TonB [Shewanella submarina]MCL1036760.1 energy transducer TonB [Shewanella submarina]
MKYVMSAFALLALTACQSTGSSDNPEYAGLTMTDGEMSKAKWRQLERYEPIYPKSDAKNRRVGCATLEYVITPDYQVQNIEVIDASRSSFANAARKSIRKWSWQQVPTGNLQQPIKTRTRFEFCINDGSGNCANEKLLNNSQCSGTDVISVVGTLIRAS